MESSVKDSLERIEKIVENITGASHVSEAWKEKVSEKMNATLLDVKDDESCKTISKSALSLFSKWTNDKIEQAASNKSAVREKLNRLEKLSKEEADLQNEIEEIENMLKNLHDKPSKDEFVELKEKVKIFKLLTNIEFDYSSQDLSGYHYNPTTKKYKTFQVDFKDPKRVDKLWKIIGENCQENE